MDRGKRVGFPRPGVLVQEFTRDEYPFVDGAHSRFFPARRGLARKEILAPAAVNIDGWWFAPGGIARFLLSTIPNGNVPAPPGSPQWARILPPWWGWGILPYAVHVDLSRAFESILRSFGVRDGAPGLYFSRTPIWFPPDPFWDGPGEKLVIRILPSAGLSRSLRLWRGPGDVRKIRKPPLDFRPWGTVVTVLHGISAVARDLGCIYWNVDGGIVPERHEEEFVEWLEAMGLSVHVKARGPALALGRGIYAIGDKMSRPYRAGAVGRMWSDGMEEFRGWTRKIVQLDH